MKQIHTAVAMYKLDKAPSGPHVNALRVYAFIKSSLSMYGKSLDKRSLHVTNVYNILSVLLVANVPVSPHFVLTQHLQVHN
jgi:hypothetical protein